MGWTAAGVIVSALAAGTGAVQNQQAQKAQKGARADQADAQSRAQAQALSAQTSEEEAMRKQNRKPADISALLGDQQAPGLGAAGSLLTGAGGIDPNRLILGRSTLLGG